MVNGCVEHGLKGRMFPASLQEKSGFHHGGGGDDVIRAQVCLRFNAHNVEWWFFVSDRAEIFRRGVFIREKLKFVQ